MGSSWGEEDQEDLLHHHRAAAAQWTTPCSARTNFLASDEKALANFRKFLAKAQLFSEVRYCPGSNRVGGRTLAFEPKERCSARSRLGGTSEDRILRNVERPRRPCRRRCARHPALGGENQITCHRRRRRREHDGVTRRVCGCRAAMGRAARPSPRARARSTAVLEVSWLISGHQRHPDEVLPMSVRDVSKPTPAMSSEAPAWPKRRGQARRSST